MKLNEAKIKKKRHKSLDPWRLYVPDWSRTSVTGVEPAAYCLGGNRSILLSYRNLSIL